MHHYLGVDLGGTNIAVGLVSADGTIQHQSSRPTNSARPASQIVDDIIFLCKEISELHDVSKGSIKAVGIGAPGHCDSAKGIIRYAANLNFKDLHISSALHKALSLPVTLGNDANVAALAESFVGAARGSDCSIMVTLGTGVGGGIVYQGKIMDGSFGLAGEIGHMAIMPKGLICTCGREGCYEQYASATALIAQARHAAAQAPDSLLYQNVGGNLENITGKTVFAAHNAADKTAKLVVNQYLYYVAFGIANLINIFDPEVITIGGGISGQGEAILAPIREFLEPMVFGGMRQTKIVPAKLGNNAGIIGAALSCTQA